MVMWILSWFEIWKGYFASDWIYILYVVGYVLLIILLRKYFHSKIIKLYLLTDDIKSQHYRRIGTKSYGLPFNIHLPNLGINKCSNDTSNKPHNQQLPTILLNKSTKDDNVCNIYKKQKDDPQKSSHEPNSSIRKDIETTK
jgi:hypothetical protein